MNIKETGETENFATLLQCCPKGMHVNMAKNAELTQ